MTPAYQVRKMSSEGSSSPFIARIFFGLLNFRDQFYLMGAQVQQRQEMLDHFDHQFKPMLEAAQATRDAAFEIKTMVESHTDAIKNGSAIQIREDQYDILESIDAALSQTVDKLIDQSIVATKTGLQSILRDPLDLEIGFFFQQDKLFFQGIVDLQKTSEIKLAQYLQDVRAAWHEDLQDLRSMHEHEGWSLEQVDYRLSGPNQVDVHLPEIIGTPVDQYSKQIANRVLLFIENLMVYAFTSRTQLPINVIEIPASCRNPVDPQRFRLAPKGLNKSTPWVLTYRDDMDFV